ncbi:DUF3300 domain-containing protein [Agromyces sp. H66]|uniref:DUF3300 domain-containing protein n=1 Tax=Agromyces sp. H66 TaxID=2529859 RepID=UPI0010AA4D8E|nr:DUF3300 domain-containing protein [Agromyces sp. H66]
MNANPLAAGTTRQGQTVELSTQARRLRQRVARRAGLALLAWSQRQDERRTSSAVQLRRQAERAGNLARDDQFQRLALLGSPMA